MGKHEEAFEAFAEQVIDLETVERIILFGSVARGVHGSRSDVDILIEVEDLSQQREIEDTAFEVASEYGVSITPLVSEGRDSSLMRTIEDEGVEYVRG